MKCLVAITACVLAALYLPAVLGVPYYPMGHYYDPSYSGGGSYFDKDFVRDGGSSRGGGFMREGSNRFYDEGEGFHRSRKVIEDEGGSRHRVGGGSHGREGGESFGRSNMFERDRVNSGRGFSGFGPRTYI